MKQRDTHQQPIDPELAPFLRALHLPDPDSHKGQNGKLLVIGGSELFHAAGKWSLDVASKFVDMVFFATAPSNITLMREAKRAFWNGIVIDRADAAGYAQEADVILIGPGMERSEETATFTNDFLKQFPDQHWVIDAGALQMADVRLFTERCIVTPHEKEWADLQQRMHAAHLSVLPSVIVQKGPTDRIFQKDHTIAEVSGGHPGMTKGGTGDVLAGLVAALYCTNPIEVAAVVGSVLNKRAGESLAHRAGPFFNASDLVEEVPKTAWELFQLSNQSKH